MAAFLVRGTAVNGRRITLNAGILSKPVHLNAEAKTSPPQPSPHSASGPQRWDGERPISEESDQPGKKIYRY